MQDTWYGDHRDVVKWGTLVHLARSEGIRKIIQVGFLRSAERPPLETDQGKVEILQEVWEHFRDVDRIHGLEGPLGLEIVVVDHVDQINGQNLFPQRRKQYIQHIADSLRNHADGKVVLLDPDTGIEPKQASPEHVKITEIQEIWEALSPGDWLVIYQHAFRDKKWREKSRIKFAQACETQDIKTFQAPKIAADVAFFAAKKE